MNDGRPSDQRGRTADPGPAGGGVVRDSAYAWAAVAFLTLVYTVSFIDRQVLNLLVEPIRGDLALTDTQMSLLQGAAFMVAYIAFGPLFGRLADVANRRNILAGGLAVWSAGTVLCGLSHDFWTLFISRATVGAAEACVMPAVWSIVGDYFTRRRLPRALSVFLIGPYLGGGLALVAGGLLVGSAGDLAALWPPLAGLAPWQITFVAVGAPGIVLALLLLLIIREPQRSADGVVAGDDRGFTLKEGLAYMWERRSLFARMFLALGCICIALYGYPAWLPTFLIRRHGASVQSIGVDYGSLVLIMGSIGVLAGPFVVGFLEKRGWPGGAMIAVAGCSMALVCISAALPFSPNYHAGLAIGAAAAFFYSMPMSITAAALALTCPNRMRGLAAATLTFVVSLAGLGVAPTAVALLTDYVFRDPGRVGDSLALACVLATAMAAFLAIGALPHYRKATAPA